jgi:hypothetical protein
LVGLLAAAAVVVFVVFAARGRRAKNLWNQELAGVIAESRWLARELLPAALATDSAAVRRQVWLASRPRVETLDNRMSDVLASAPKDQLPGLGRLREALTDVRSAMDADAAAGPPGDGESLGAARQAQRQLEEALRAFQPGPGRAESTPPPG